MTFRTLFTYLAAFIAIFMSIILAVYFLQTPKLKADEFKDISKFMTISKDVDLDEIQESLQTNKNSNTTQAKTNKKQLEQTTSKQTKQIIPKQTELKKEPNIKTNKKPTTKTQLQSKEKKIVITPKPVTTAKAKTSKPTINKYNQQSSLGINTNEVFEQDASIPFIDLFRVATPFNENIRCREKDKPCLTNAEVEYDKNGWPKKLNGGKAGVFFLRNVALKALPEGNFTVLYDGEGQIDYQQNAKLVSRKAGEDTIKFDARADGFMTAVAQITKSKVSNPLKNIRIIMPGGICEDSPYQHVTDKTECTDSEFLDFKTHHASIIFNPDYLNFMKDFGVIRLMPMSGITRNPDERWEQRPHLQEATWGGIYGSRGAPLEIQIELANRLQADPWLNVPHIADDNYMRKFTEYVKDNLSPNLTPHIEYTNEAWNSNFVHNEHMQKMGIAQKLDQDALLAGYKYYAKRSVEFFNIWDDVYGGQIKNGKKQFVRIIGGWDTRPDISSIILAYKDTYKSTDAIAIAPYIGGNLRGFRESKTVDDIFKLLTDKKSYRSLPKIMEELEKHAKLAKEFGVSLIAYEGGQGLVDWAARDYLQHPNPLFYAANRDSRMNDLYQDLYKEWRGLGADLFVAFSAPRSCNWSGCWGLKEHIKQAENKAPKLQASLQFIKDNKRWWQWDKKSQKSQPASSKVAKYLKPLNPKKPRIVLRPAKKKATTKNKLNYRFENPQALNLLLEGETWDKRDMSGKWQVKWDKKNIYFSAKVYDKEISKDTSDPVNDDSIEFFIDTNNSRGSKFDKKNDFHFIFARNKNIAIMGKQSPKKKINIPYEIEEKYDGYELRAKISWKALGKRPSVKNKLSMEVIMNDDDDTEENAKENSQDNGKRDARISWNSRNINPKPRDFGMVLISGR